MSQHYCASQFSDAFKPIRLLNYNPFNNTPCDPYGVHAMCLPDRCGKTQVIADDNGWLFPCIPRGCSSPWGDYAYSIWEQPPKGDCDCIMQLRHPENFRPPRQIYIAREEHDAETESERVAKCLNKNGWGDPPCLVPAKPGCPLNPCATDCQFQMKLLLCGDDPVERKRLFKELRRQQMVYKRMLCSNRGRFKGQPPFSPGTLCMLTWDNCAGARSKRRVWGKALACPCR